ncbi:peptidase inhibitor family I36 protein [Streptomyces lavenduligriseus]|uniref:Peptidase inhibitor family I36 protein n=1 Tax=Streptomyces lavenduligriseus TaxID=67315 RepID=A0ABT0P6I1_9ACTN|nr:peptidase inhibitor family I36 protein [Streptomyces lavenduligriseus]MCL3998981.1 peptidase inhibitor family I36 protein [Streptomyces lavenduligriseus]
MKRFITALSAGLLAVGAVLTTSVSAHAAACGSGHFCAWTDANFSGLKIEWTGDDGWWEGNIADQDSSWANHGISGPGIKDHVRVYANAWQGGDMTICLAPGQEAGFNGGANDRGDSHTWAMGC